MLTYEQSVFNRYHSDKHFSEFLPTRWRQKSTAIDMEQNYATVTLCIQLAWKWKSFIRYGSNACWIHIITIKYKHRLDNKNIKI